MDPTLRPCERIHHYWIHCLPSIHGRGSAVLDKAIMTLCAGFLGRVMSDEGMQQRAMTMYGEALRGLSTIMAAPNFVAASDSLLAAVMCLGMAEVYSAPTTQSPQDIGWASHNKGGCELLVSRGASILRSELGRGLLLRFRVTGVWTQLVYQPFRAVLNSGPPAKQFYTAVGRRKPFPFADEPLRQIAKAANQNYYDTLIDAMVDIPGLLHDLDTIRQACFISKDDVRDVLARSIETTAALAQWRADFQAENPSAFQWHHRVVVDRPRPHHARDSDHNVNDPDLVPHAGGLRFQNLLAAQAVTHFWAALVVLARCVAMCQALSMGTDMDLVTEMEIGEEVREACMQLWECASPSLPGGSASVSSSPSSSSSSSSSSVGAPWELACWEVLPDPRALGCRFADMICSAAGYFTARERGMSGPIILLFPLWIAKDMYANMHDGLARRKEGFCLKVFAGLAARGMKISDALVSLSTKTP
jgi:hypothetical protein